MASASPLAASSANRLAGSEVGDGADSRDGASAPRLPLPRRARSIAPRGCDAMGEKVVAPRRVLTVFALRRGETGADSEARRGVTSPRCLARL